MVETRAFVITLAFWFCACGSDATPSSMPSVAPVARWTIHARGEAVGVATNRAHEIFFAANGDDTIDLAAVDVDAASIWNRSFAAHHSARARAMSLDPTSSIALVGELFGTTELGGPPLVAPSCTDAAHPDVFVARYDGDGYFLWANRIGDCDADTATAVATFGTDVVVGGSIGGASFVARFDGGGVSKWSTRLGVPAVAALAVDAEERVLVVGSDATLLTLGVDGTTIATRTLDGAGSMHATSIALVGGVGDGVLVGGVTGTTARLVSTSADGIARRVLAFDARSTVVALTTTERGDVVFGGAQIARFDARDSVVWSTYVEGATSIALAAAADDVYALSSNVSGDLALTWFSR